MISSLISRQCAGLQTLSGSAVEWQSDAHTMAFFREKSEKSQTYAALYDGRRSRHLEQIRSYRDVGWQLDVARWPCAGLVASVFTPALSSSVSTQSLDWWIL